MQVSLLACRATAEEKGPGGDAPGRFRPARTRLPAAGRSLFHLEVAMVTPAGSKFAPALLSLLLCLQWWLRGSDCRPTTRDGERGGGGDAVGASREGAGHSDPRRGARRRLRISPPGGAAVPSSVFSVGVFPGAGCRHPVKKKNRKEVAWEKAVG